MDDQAIAMVLQRNKVEIDRLQQENKRLTELMVGKPEQTWIADGIHYRVKVAEGRRMFRMDDEIFRLAVPNHSEYEMRVPDKARIQKAIDEERFPNWHRWASITKSAPYLYIKADPVDQEGEQ